MMTKMEYLDIEIERIEARAKGYRAFDLNGDFQQMAAVLEREIHALRMLRAEERENQERKVKR